MKSKLIISLIFSCGIIFSQTKPSEISYHEFAGFLQSALENEVVNDSTTQLFYRESREYWWNHILDYNHHPEKYAEALSLYFQNMIN